MNNKIENGIFNLETGKIDKEGTVHRADEYLHVEIPHGMLSFLMPEEEIIQFIEFLSAVKSNPNGHSMMGTTHSYESEPYRDDGFVNLLFYDMIVVVALVIKVEYIDALISYLNDHREG